MLTFVHGSLFVTIKQVQIPKKGCFSEGDLFCNETRQLRIELGQYECRRPDHYTYYHKDEPGIEWNICLLPIVKHAYIEFFDI